MERVCIIGLDEPEVTELRERINAPMIAHENMPCILVRDGELLVEPKRGPGFLSVSQVVFHSIYDNDMDFLAGLAMWGGPCLPNALSMLDCRLKLPCLARAMRYTRFPTPGRGYAAPHTPFVADAGTEMVAKWGNWHCGENKARFTGIWNSEQACIIEPFLPGSAVRVVAIGDQSWQIRLEGRNWLKSIHAPDADFMELDPELLADTLNLREALGLEIIANDYMVSDTGSKHLLEVNHIPNVTRFPEIWQAYRNYVVAWLARAA